MGELKEQFDKKNFSYDFEEAHEYNCDRTFNTLQLSHKFWPSPLYDLTFYYTIEILECDMNNICKLKFSWRCDEDFISTMDGLYENSLKINNGHNSKLESVWRANGVVPSTSGNSYFQFPEIVYGRIQFLEPKDEILKMHSESISNRKTDYLNYSIVNAEDFSDDESIYEDFFDEHDVEDPNDDFVEANV